MVDVVLVYPRTGQDQSPSVGPPHSLLALAGPLLQAGYNVQIIDQRVDSRWRDHLAEALWTQPICVGISAMTGRQTHFALEAARAARDIGRGPIIWGGPHPTTMPGQTLESDLVDIVCIGEGEKTFLDLIDALAGKRPLHQVQGIAYKDGGKLVLTGPRPLVDMDSLLLVPWHLVPVEKYIHPEMYLGQSPRTLDIGQTSRGCPFSCTFCSSASLRHRRWRPMSVARALEAIREPVKRFNLTGIRIRDDEFYIDRDRVSSICAEMVREDLNVVWYTSGTRIDVFNRATDDEIDLLRRSGARGLKFGAESGSSRILSLMNKGITPTDTRHANLRARRHGIRPVFAFMAGWPSETWGEVKETLDLVEGLRRDNPGAFFDPLSPATALPGTPLWEQALGLGLQPPETLEGWGEWVFGNYDPDGRRLPWLSARDRRRIYDLCRTYFMAYCFAHTLDGVRGSRLRAMMKALYAPVGAAYRWRLKHQSSGAR